MEMVSKLKRYRFFLFLVIGSVLIMIFIKIAPSYPIFNFIFAPLTIITNYFINVLQNLNNLNLFSFDYFWVFDLSSWSYWMFIFLSVFCFSIVLTILTGKNENLKKKVLILLFIFYTFSLIIIGYGLFSSLNSIEKLVVGSGNIGIFLRRFSILIVSLIILSYIWKKNNLRFFLREFISYFFIILKILLALFVGLIFKEMILHPGASVMDKIMFILFVIFLGFFFFLIIEQTEKYLLNLLKSRLKVLNILRGKHPLTTPKLSL